MIPETEKIYDQFPFETRFRATVLFCSPREDDMFDLILDRTAFFPEQGGQDADEGILYEEDTPEKYTTILDVQIDSDGVIHHKVADFLTPGFTFIGEVDEDKRFDYMQQHSGEHIVSGLAHSLYGATNVGFHLSRREVTLDFDMPLTDEQVEELEFIANTAIYENHPVVAKIYPDYASLGELQYRSKKELRGPIRIVTIEGIDVCACCAPHVKSTGQIGMIKIIHYEPHRGGMRLTIVCGARALALFRGMKEVTDTVSAQVSAPLYRIPEAVDKLKGEVLSEKEKRIRAQKELLATRLHNIPSEEKNPVLTIEELDIPAARDAVNELMKVHEGFCAILVGNEDDGFTFVIGSTKKDCKALAAVLRKTIGAKCGGSERQITGTLPTSESLLKIFDTGFENL